MKRFILSFVLIVAWSHHALSQSETGADNIPPISLDGTKNFDGFLLDMGAMLQAPPQLISPSLTYQPYHWVSNEYEWSRLHFNPNVTYGKYTSNFNSSYRNNGLINWQSATYQLNNGIRITTYGEYDANGRKVYNPSALPWERNNFNGAFEMKSENGKFGIRIEVQQGRR